MVQLNLNRNLLIVKKNNENCSKKLINNNLLLLMELQSGKVVISTIISSFKHSNQFLNGAL